MRAIEIDVEVMNADASMQSKFFVVSGGDWRFLIAGYSRFSRFAIA